MCLMLVWWVTGPWSVDFLLCDASAFIPYSNCIDLFWDLRHFFLLQSTRHYGECMYQCFGGTAYQLGRLSRKPITPFRKWTSQYY